MGSQIISICASTGANAGHKCPLISPNNALLTPQSQPLTHARANYSACGFYGPCIFYEGQLKANDVAWIAVHHYFTRVNHTEGLRWWGGGNGPLCGFFFLLFFFPQDRSGGGKKKQKFQKVVWVEASFLIRMNICELCGETLDKCEEQKIVFYSHCANAYAHARTQWRASYSETVVS